jgi:ribosomal protein S17E
VKEKVKESNLVILQLKKENEKILNEYEDVFKKNLELNLQLKSLNMEIQSLNIEKREKISQLEQVINEQKEIIESLKEKNPH